MRAKLSGVKRKLFELRVVVTGFALYCVAHAVMLLRPRDRWYWDVRFVSRQLARVIHLFFPNVIDPSLEARLLHRFLDGLSDGGRRFPIPVQVENLELLREIASQEGGFVCCGAHVPFVKLFIPVVRSVLRPGVELVGMVKYLKPDGYVDIWNDQPLRAMAAGAGVLLQTRSLLRRGGCLLLLTDKEQGEFISSNIFRFVGKVQSRVLMAFPHLLDDGTILLKFVEAPAPACRNEGEVRANLDFIAQMVRSILAGGQTPEKLRASVMPLAQVHVAERGREIDRIQLYSRSQLEARAKRLEQMLADKSIGVADRALYEKRLSIMQQELNIRSQVRTRAEFGPDGKPLR